MCLYHHSMLDIRPQEVSVRARLRAALCLHVHAWDSVFTCLCNRVLETVCAAACLPSAAVHLALPFLHVWKNTGGFTHATFPNSIRIIHLLWF